MGKKGPPKMRGGELQPKIAAEYGVSCKQPTFDDTLAPDEIAEILNVTGAAVKQWIYHRRLPAVKTMNGRWRVRKADLEQFLKDRVIRSCQKVLLALPPHELPAVIEAIKAAGHNALAVSTLIDATIKLVDVRPNLVMIDVSWKDCWKLAETVRTTNPTKHLSLLFVGAKKMDDADMVRMAKLNAQGFVQLPASKERLMGEINRCLFRT